MMTEEQVKTVTKVLRTFSVADGKAVEWTHIDECISLLEYMDNAQLVTEAAVMLAKHKEGDPRCIYEHPRSECFIPTIIDATDIIVNLYNETKSLHPNNRYILLYYLGMTAAGEIIS